MAEVVLWLLRFVNIDVVFVKSEQVMFAETLILSELTDRWNWYSFGFLRDVLYPNVAALYNGPIRRMRGLRLSNRSIWAKDVDST